ncbi:mechanosensitive ion channel domain-containing protein [Oceanihabitans sediminis]|uniref:Mechanosensitive ion channel family protein n=1 Tax=Oceanihabitans sediminis TaxID=1812012 RepID=A0A368P6K3_9FLAO|nr:mechanosensitive ion channel domain-containing protein [Oceanihabitans sediminis]MDX1278838.1 mechanosensitive ion channel [Oceanihabitans sediminis]MDX1773305.1 mechanosensitive ion channel [Oceanihabitans sediminis]RBP32737.1 mechanosensitive ion channel-like protein [Oceanihabitans sediminis]RCU57724.1 mechanosensitive ion channel family protein [Oceanihabitans sediminis]
MTNFIDTYQNQIFNSLIILGVFFAILMILKISIRKIGKKSGINDARIHLIIRYTTVSLFLLSLLVLAFIFGAQFEDLALVFSSVFAVIGIALFAIWSILSNITSGVIMFFSFPYKVGDKIQIHDKDYPIEAIIEDIRAFQLHLRLDNGNLITYPNNLILQKPVTLVQKDAIEDFENGTDLI